ncbi:hypothetical protein J437_LFUL003646 [Ladona fulva]|uniref:Phosphotransferase n=1 Tax=Ladona fulva TaxID=123851 RepID=A0A8K0K5B2_LADFU|nr:hypothetical protein J437_LFUL003646 [Ladona fulva]
MLSGLHLTTDIVRRIERIFESEIEKGLARGSGDPHVSSLQMENTYIPELPNGTEQGQYLALDLGGTNFRVLLLELEHAPDGGRLQDIVVREEVKHYHIPDEMRLGCGRELFDYLAYCLHDFVTDKKVEGALTEFNHNHDGDRHQSPLPLGFTFSFPMEHHSLDVGILVSWTKSFKCSNTVGHDVVKMLREAIERHGDMDVEVEAILNDTTGTLVQGANLDPRTAIGCILGTGSNACYIEKASKVKHWEGDRHGEKEVIIDIEWGAFGDNGVIDFMKTEFDREVDNKSLLVNSFTFEKYISGKYLGEINRTILEKLCREGLLFGGKASEKLLKHDSFSAHFVSLIEGDTIQGITTETEKILKDLGLKYTSDDIKIVQHVCELTSNRAALLVSICLATLLRRMNRPDTTIAVDGSLYKFHPRLKTLMNKYIHLLAPGKKFRLMLAEDGSGKGAALAAAIAKRLRRRLMNET